MIDSQNKKNMNQKIIRHRIVIFYWVIIIILLILAVISGLFYYWTRIKYTKYEIHQEYSFQKTDDSYIEPLNNSIVLYSSDGMSCIDSKGKTIWNQTYEIQNPVVRTCENVIAIADYNGRNIYVANTDKILGTINTTMPIRDFSVAANGIVAAVLDDSNITGIYLFDTSGNNMVYFKTQISNSGYPIALDISKDGKQVAISYMKAEAGEVSTYVGFYNFSAVGQNYTDNLVGGYGYKNLIVPLVSFMNNDTIIALGDSKLMYYQGKQIPVNIGDTWIQNEIKSVYKTNDYLGLVYANTTGESKYLLDIYNTSGNVTVSLPFDLEYKDIVFDSNGIVIYSDTECQIYNWKKNLKYEGLFKDSVRYVLTTGAIDKYILVTESSIQNIVLE